MLLWPHGRPNHNIPSAMLVPLHHTSLSSWGAFSYTDDKSNILPVFFFSTCLDLNRKSNNPKNLLAAIKALQNPPNLQMILFIGDWNSATVQWHDLNCSVLSLWLNVSLVSSKLFRISFAVSRMKSPQKDTFTCLFVCGHEKFFLSRH